MKKFWIFRVKSKMGKKNIYNKKKEKKERDKI